MIRFSTTVNQYLFTKNNGLSRITRPITEENKAKAHAITRRLLLNSNFLDTLRRTEMFFSINFRVEF